MGRDDFNERLNKISVDHQEKFPDGIPILPESEERESFLASGILQSFAARIVVILLGFIPYTLYGLFEVGLFTGMSEIFDSTAMKVSVALMVPFLAIAFLASDTEGHWPEGWGLLFWIVIGVVLSNFFVGYIAGEIVGARYFS